MIPIAAPDLSAKELQFLTDAFHSGYLSHRGQYVEQFEKDFIGWLDVWSNQDNWCEALACSSGTAAMHLALLNCGIKRGDKVIVPDICFPTVASVVKHMGGKLVIVDVGDDHLIDPEKVFEVIDDRTRVVIAVDLYGESCDVLTLTDICDDHNLVLIQDGCESLGFVHPYGGYSVYSFFANKIMTTGEGGMLVAKDLSEIKLYRDGGWDNNYSMTVPGLNYRMTNLQAAIGCAQLQRLDEMASKHVDQVHRYARHFKGYGKWLFVMDCKLPAILKERLAKAGIETRPVFYPLHLQAPFRRSGRFPNAIKTWSAGLCLPTGTHLTEFDQTKIIDTIKEIQCDFSESL